MFPSDTYPVFPVRITRPRNPPNFAAGDPNTNIVGAHVQCEKELEGTVGIMSIVKKMKLLMEWIHLSNAEMNKRLIVTNDGIETLKKDMKAEIEALKTELENLKKIPGGNIEAEDLKKQLDGKRLMEFAINT